MIQNRHYKNQIDGHYKKHMKVGFIDEVGRGCLAGDLYACCVVLDSNKFFDDRINDSKQLSKELINELSPLIKTSVLAYNIGIATIDEINTIRNMHDVTMFAMQRSVSDLDKSMWPDVLYIDGTWKINSTLPQYAVIKGDSSIFGIACASIIAKQARDAYMQLLHEYHPDYDWKNNVGYGTPKHLAALKKLGPTAYHRMYFAGVKDTPIVSK